jgi:hypothetical protein
MLATQAFAAGYDAVAVAGRGGWTNPTTAADIYAEAIPARDQEFAKFMAALIDDPSGASDGGGRG